MNVPPGTQTMPLHGGGPGRADRPAAACGRDGAVVVTSLPISPPWSRGRVCSPSPRGVCAHPGLVNAGHPDGDAEELCDDAHCSTSPRYVSATTRAPARTAADPDGGRSAMPLGCPQEG